MTEKINKLNFKFLPAYAAFLLKEKMQDFVKEGIVISREEDLPILKYFTAFTDEQLVELGMKANEELLSALANNKAREYVKKALANWSANRIEGIERENLAIDDITMVAFVRNKLLRKFLPFYTKDFELYNNILEDIDRFISEAAAIGFKVYLSFQQEKIKIINSILSNREEQAHRLVEDLQEKRENLKQLIENAPDAIIVIDKNSIVQLWNPKAEIIFGWKAEEVIGLALSDKIIPKDHREAHKKGMQRFLSTGQSNILNHSLELNAINKNNEELCTSITISQTMQAGEIAFIAFIRDISSEKRNQVELRKKTLQLLELNNSLADKNSELERINKELESFNYVASHDLQEPLRKIQIYSNRLIEKDIAILPPHTLEYISKIQTSSTWMQRLIEDLLSFSQLTSPSEAFQEVDLNVLLQEVKSMLCIEEKNVRIESEHLPTIKVIPFQFAQLFSNIIGNSIRYAKENSNSHIRISSKMVNAEELFLPEAPAGKYFQLSISDNGIGFEQEYAEKIFDLFKRLHAKGKYTGTGIGLSICKKIVHNHQGFIKAESKDGEGATFHIYLPS